MATTYFQGAIKTGSGFSEQQGATAVAASDTGYITQAKSVTVQAATAASVDATIVLPPNSQILDFLCDSTVAWTATTASLTIGTAAGGAQYVTGFDVKTVTRGPTAAFTAAQLLAMSNITTNTSVFIRVASTGANATGTTTVTVRYIQTQ
jgi:hypothetical protein